MYSGCFVQLEVRKCPCLFSKTYCCRNESVPYLSLHHRILVVIFFSAWQLCDCAEPAEESKSFWRQDSKVYDEVSSSVRAS